MSVLRIVVLNTQAANVTLNKVLYDKMTTDKSRLSFTTTTKIHKYKRL